MVCLLHCKRKCKCKSHCLIWIASLRVTESNEYYTENHITVAYNTAISASSRLDLQMLSTDIK